MGLLLRRDNEQQEKSFPLFGIFCHKFRYKQRFPVTHFLSVSTLHLNQDCYLSFVYLYAAVMEVFVANQNRVLYVCYVGHWGSSNEEIVMKIQISVVSFAFSNLEKKRIVFLLVRASLIEVSKEQKAAVGHLDAGHFRGERLFSTRTNRMAKAEIPAVLPVPQVKGTVFGQCNKVGTALIGWMCS